LTAKKAGIRLKDMAIAKQKRQTPTANNKEEVRHVGAAEGQAPACKSRKLLVRAFSHPEGSSERLQAFSKYLNALHDEHAK
jgi:hypothetical protein